VEKGVKNGKRVCWVCGCRSKNERFEIPGLYFGYVKPEKFICERCLAKKVFNHSFEWKEEIENKLE